MHRRKIELIILVMLVACGLIGCAVQMPGNQGKVKVIPRTDEQEELRVRRVGQLARGIAWDLSPDGQSVLLSDIEEANPGNVSKDAPVESRLYILNIAEGEKRQLASSDQGISDAKFSADGSYIGFMEIFMGDFTTHVLANDPEATVTQVEVEMASPPMVWFPTEDQFVLRVMQEGGGWKLVAYDTQGQTRGDLVVKRELIYLPTFYDADTLLYGYQQTIWAQNLTGSPEVRKVVAGFDYALTPDRQLIAYRPVGDEGTYTLRIDRLGEDLVVDETVTELELEWSPRIDWSPNSQYLAYSDGGVIWVRNPRTGARKQLISGMEQVIALFWRNDQELIFSGIPREGTDGDVLIYLIQLEMGQLEEG